MLSLVGQRVLPLRITEVTGVDLARTQSPGHTKSKGPGNRSKPKTVDESMDSTVTRGTFRS
jgi:hypothetical protein